LPTPTVSPTSTATLPLPPVEPELAREHTQAGAWAFSAHFIHVLNWSIANGTTDVLAGLVSPSCQACARFIANIRKEKLAGLSRGGLAVDKTWLPVGQHLNYRSDFAFYYELTETASVRPGETPKRLVSDSIVFVSWADDHWKITEQAVP
jgi:hypothetical protein